MNSSSKKGRGSKNNRTTLSTKNHRFTTNDADNEGQLASEHVIRNSIVSQFPQDHLVHCFGYGSGVFSQSLTKEDIGVNAGMLDLILVVENTEGFHEQNMRRFPHHYATWLSSGGPNLATRMQRKGIPCLRDARVLFHVVDEDRENNLPKMKYGVVDKQDLLSDLLEWDSLYLAGRLHKPTLPIVANDEEILLAQKTNLRAATAAALLLSSENPTKTDCSTLSWLHLYRQIAALSYTGDFRMQVGGEDPLKVDKLVQAPGQLERFHDLYQPILKSYETSGILSTSKPLSEKGGVDWNPRDPLAIKYLWHELPRSLHEDANRMKITSMSVDNSSFLDRESLAKALATIVAPAARNQSLKGVFTLGFRKSIQYATAKLSKGLLSRK